MKFQLEEYILNDSAKIIGAVLGDFYSLMTHREYPTWDNKYPLWKTKPVYNVFYKEPVKPNSIEDFQNLYPEKSYSDIELMYMAQPSYHLISIPEEELIQNLENIKNENSN